MLAFTCLLAVPVSSAVCTCSHIRNCGVTAYDEYTCFVAPICARVSLHTSHLFSPDRMRLMLLYGLCFS